MFVGKKQTILLSKTRLNPDFRTMKNLIVAAILAACVEPALAQVANELPLWPGGAPGRLGNEKKDTPTLTPFLPASGSASGAAMVICPGGGYGGLAGHEGKDYALWLNENGIAGFVLKYRLGSDGYRHPAMLQDAARALRLVRSEAVRWNLDPHRIGIMGSSAGGHLASTLLTHFDAGDASAPDPVERQSSRPDLGVLCYAVVTMGEGTHRGSRNNLLGTNPPPELVRGLSSELQVTRQTPPCFLWHTLEDSAVKMENSLNFARALRENGVAFDLHIYQKGRHGLGLGAPYSEPAKWLPWTHDCSYWLKLQGFSNK